MPIHPGNKRNRKSPRAKWWDYRWSGVYFLTLCTKGRKHYFGEIKNGQLIYSPSGAIADLLWHEIPKRYPYIKLGAFVVMPDHLHGILFLEQPEEERTSERTSHGLSGQRFRNPGKHSISTIMGGYKAAVTKHARRMGFEFAWQSRFHDSILWEEENLRRVTRYIENNPKNWKKNSLFEEE